MSNKEILKVENLTKKYSGKIVVLIISLLGFTSISSYIIGTILFGCGDGVMMDGN